MTIHSNLINRKIQSRKGSYSQNSPYWVELKNRPQKWWYFVLISLCFLFPKTQLAIIDDRITINFLNKKTGKKNLETSFLLDSNKNHTNQIRKANDFIDVDVCNSSNNLEYNSSKLDLMVFPNLPSWSKVQNYQINSTKTNELQNLSELPIFQKIVIDVDEIIKTIEPVNLSLQNKRESSSTYHSTGFYSPHSFTIDPFQKESLLNEALISFKRNLIHGYTINKNQIKERISLDNINLALINVDELLFKWDNQIYKNNGNENIQSIIKKIVDQLQTCQQLLNSRINIQNATQRELISKALDYSVTELQPLHGEELNFEQWNLICQFLHFLTTTISLKSRSLEYIESPSFFNFVRINREELERARKKAQEALRKKEEEEKKTDGKEETKKEEKKDEKDASEEMKENESEEEKEKRKEEAEKIRLSKLSREARQFEELFKKSSEKLVDKEREEEETKKKNKKDKEDKKGKKVRIKTENILKLRKVDYERSLLHPNKIQRNQGSKPILFSFSLPKVAIEVSKPLARPFRMLTHPLDLPIIDSYLRTLYPFAIKQAYFKAKGIPELEFDEETGDKIIPKNKAAEFVKRFEIKPIYIENKYLRAVGGFFYRNIKRVIVNSPRLTYLGYMEGRSLSNHLTYFTEGGRRKKYHKIPLRNRVKTYRQFEKLQAGDSPYSLLNTELGNLMYSNPSIKQEAVDLDPYGLHELIQQFALELELKRLALEENNCEDSPTIDETIHDKNLLDMYRKVIDKILSLLIQGILPTVDLDRTTNARYGTYLSPDSVANFNLILMNIINTNLKLFKNINDITENYSNKNDDQTTETNRNEGSKYNILYENQILHNPIDVNIRFEKIEENIYNTQALLNEAISVLDQRKRKNSVNYNENLAGELDYKPISLKKKFKTSLIPKFIYKQENISVNKELNKHVNKEIILKTNKNDFIDQFGDFTHETKEYFEIVRYLINQNNDIDVSSFHKLIQFIDNTDNHLNNQTIPYIWNFFIDERDKQLSLAFDRIKDTQEFVEKTYEDLINKAELIDNELLPFFEDDESNEFDLKMSDEFADELDDVDEKDEELALNLIETEKAIERGDESWFRTYKYELFRAAEEFDPDKLKLIEKGAKLPDEMKLDILDEKRRLVVKGNTDSQLYPLLKKYMLLERLIQKVQARLINLVPDIESFHKSSDGIKIHKIAQRRFDEYILSKLTKFYTLEKYIQYLKQYNQSQKIWGFHESHEYFRNMQLRNEFYNILNNQIINLVGPINFRLNLKENKSRDFSSGSSSLIRILELVNATKLKKSAIKKRMEDLRKEKFDEAEYPDDFEKNTGANFYLESLFNKRKIKFPPKLESRTAEEFKKLEKGFKDDYREELRGEETLPECGDANGYIQKFIESKVKKKPELKDEKSMPEEVLMDDLVNAKPTWHYKEFQKDSNWNHLAGNVKKKRHYFDNYNKLPLRSPRLFPKRIPDLDTLRYLENNLAGIVGRAVRLGDKDDSLYAVTKRENIENEERLLNKLGNLIDFESDGSGGSVKRNTPFQGSNFNIELDTNLNEDDNIDLSKYEHTDLNEISENNDLELNSLENNKIHVAEEDRETVTEQVVKKENFGSCKKIIRKVIDKQRKYQNKIDYIIDDADLTYQPLDFIKDRLNLKLEDEYYNRQMRYISDRFNPNSYSKFNELSDELNELRPDPIASSEDWSTQSQSVNAKKSANWVNHRIEKNVTRLQHGVKNVRNLLNIRKRLLIQIHQNSILLPGLRSYRLKLILKKNFFKSNKVSKFEESRITNLALRLRGSKILSFASIGNIPFEQNLIRLLTEGMEGDVITQDFQKEFRDNSDNIEQSNQRNWLCFINTLITAPLHGLAPLIKLAMVKKFDKLINDPLIWEPEPSYNFLRDRVIVQPHEQSKLASNINGSNKLLPSAPTELINNFLVEGNFNENLFKDLKLRRTRKEKVPTDPFDVFTDKSSIFKKLLIFNERLNPYSLPGKILLSKKVDYLRDLFFKNYMRLAKQRNLNDLIIENKVPKSTPPKNEPKPALEIPAKLTTNNPNLVRGLVSNPVVLPPHPKTSTLGEIPSNEKELADILSNTGERAEEIIYHPTSRLPMSTRSLVYNEARKYNEAKKKYNEEIRRKEAEITNNALNKLPISNNNLDKDEKAPHRSPDKTKISSDISNYKNIKNKAIYYFLGITEDEPAAKPSAEILSAQYKEVPEDKTDKWLPSGRFIQEANKFLIKPFAFEEDSDSSSSNDSEESFYSIETDSDNYYENNTANTSKFFDETKVSRLMPLSEDKFKGFDEKIKSEYYLSEESDSDSLSSCNNSNSSISVESLSKTNEEDWEEIIESRPTEIDSQYGRDSLLSLSDSELENVDTLVFNSELSDDPEEYFDTNSDFESVSSSSSDSDSDHNNYNLSLNFNSSSSDYSTSNSNSSYSSDSSDFSLDSKSTSSGDSDSSIESSLSSGSSDSGISYNSYSDDSIYSTNDSSEISNSTSSIDSESSTTPASSDYNSDDALLSNLNSSDSESQYATDSNSEDNSNIESSSDYSTDSISDSLEYTSSNDSEDEPNLNLLNTIDYNTDIDKGYESGSEFSSESSNDFDFGFEYNGEYNYEPYVYDSENDSELSGESSEDGSVYYDAQEEFPASPPPSSPLFLSDASDLETEESDPDGGFRIEDFEEDEIPFAGPEPPDIIRLYNKLKSSRKLHRSLLTFLFDQLFTEFGSKANSKFALTESNKQLFELFRNEYLDSANATKRYQPQLLHPSYEDRLKSATFSNKSNPKPNAIPLEVRKLDDHESNLLFLLRHNIPFLSAIAPKKTVINEDYLDDENLHFFASDISSDILGHGKSLIRGAVFDNVNLYSPALKRKQEKFLTNLYIQHEQIQNYITLFDNIRQIFDKNQNTLLNDNFDHRTALRLQSYYSHELHQDIIKIANSLTNAARKSKRRSQLSNQFVIDELSLFKLHELFHIFSKIGHKKMQLTSKHLRKFKKKEIQSLWTDEAISQIIQDNLTKQAEKFFIGKIILRNIAKYYRKVYQAPFRRGFTQKEIAKSIRKGGTMHVFPLKFKDLVIKNRQSDRPSIGRPNSKTGVAYVPIDLPEEVEDKYGDFLVDFLSAVPLDTKLRYVDKDIQDMEIDPHLYYRDFSKYEYQIKNFRSKFVLYNLLVKYAFEKDILKIKPSIDRKISKELFKLITGKPWYVGKYAHNIVKKYKSVDRFARLNNFAVITPDVVLLHTAVRKLKRGNTKLFVELMDKYNINTKSNLTRQKRSQYNIRPMQYLNPWFIVNIGRKKYVDQFNLLVKAIQTSGWNENREGFILGNLGTLNKIRLARPENKFIYTKDKQIKNNKRNSSRDNVLKFSQILTRSDHTNWPYWVLNKVINSQREAFLHTQAFESNSLRRNENFSDLILDDTNYPPLIADKNKFMNYSWPAYKNMNLYAGPAQDSNWNSYFDFINKNPDPKKYETVELTKLKTLLSDYMNYKKNIELGNDDPFVLQHLESVFDSQDNRNELKHFIDDPEQRDFIRSFKLKGENFPRTFTELHIAKENHFDDLIAADTLPYRVYIRLLLENPNNFKIKVTPNYSVNFGSSSTKIFYSLHSPHLFSQSKIASDRLAGQFPGIWASPQLQSWELIERDTPRPDYTELDEEDIESEFLDDMALNVRDCELSLFDSSVDEYCKRGYTFSEDDGPGNESAELSYIDNDIENQHRYKTLMVPFEKSDEYEDPEEILHWLNEDFTYDVDHEEYPVEIVGKPRKRPNKGKNRFGINMTQRNSSEATKKRSLNIFEKIKEIRAKLREEVVAEMQLSEQERFDLEQHRKRLLLRHIRAEAGEKGETLSRSEENNRVDQALTRIKGYQIKLLETVPTKKKVRSKSSRILNKRLTKSLKRILAKFYAILPEESAVSVALQEFEKRNFKGKKLFKTSDLDESASKPKYNVDNRLYKLTEMAKRKMKTISKDEGRDLSVLVPNILDKFFQLPNPQNVVSFKNDYILSPIPGIEEDYSDFKAETYENTNFRRKIKTANKVFFKSNSQGLINSYLTDSSKARNAKFLSMERPRFSKSIQIILPENSLLQLTILCLYVSYYTYILYACIELILNRPLFEKLKGSIRDTRRLGFILDSINPSSFKRLELYLNAWTQKRRSLLMYRFTRTPENLLIKEKYKDNYTCPENIETIQSIFNRHEILLKFSYNPIKWLTSSFASEHFAVLALGSPEYGQIWARSLFLQENISCFSFELYPSLFYNYQKVVYMSNNAEGNFTIIPSQLRQHQMNHRPTKAAIPLMSLRFGLSTLFASKNKKFRLKNERELLGRYKSQYKIDILYSQNILKRCVNFARENSPCFMILNGLDRAILAHRSKEDGEFWVGGIFGEFRKLPLSTTYPFTQLFQDEIIDSIGNLLERIKPNSLYKVCLIIPDSSRIDYRLLLKKRFYFQYILEDINDLNKIDRENSRQPQPGYLEDNQLLKGYSLLDSINPTIKDLNIPTAETTARFVESHKVISSQNSDMALTESIDVREYLNRYIFPVMYMYIAASSSRKILPRLATYMTRSLVYTHFFKEWRVIHQEQNHSEISWKNNYIINEFLIPILFLNLDNISLYRYLESKDKQAMFIYFYLNICLYNHIIFMLNEPNI